MQLPSPKTSAILRQAAFYSLLVFWATLSFSNALAEISFVIALAAGALSSVGSPAALPKLPRSMVISLAAFLGLVLLSAVFSERPDASLRGILKVLQQVAVFFLVFKLFNSRQSLTRFEHFFIVFAAVICLDALVQYFFGRDFLRGHAPEASGAGVRLSAGFGGYGKLACYLIMTLPYLAALAAERFRIGRKPLAGFAGLTAAAGLVVLFLTRSRGAFLALAAGLGAMLVLKRRWKWIAALVLAGGAFLAVLPRNMIIHLDAEKKEQSVVERVELWRRALHVIEAKPILGTGINTYAAVHAQYDKTQNWRVRNYYAHNGYLQLAAECGLPALICFLAFLGFVFWEGLAGTALAGEESRLLAGLLTGMLNFMAMAAVDTMLHSERSALAFWFLLGLILAYRRIQKQKLEAPEQKG